MRTGLSSRVGGGSRAATVGRVREQQNSTTPLRQAPAQRDLSRQLIAPLPGSTSPRRGARRASATILFAVGILAAGTTVWGGWQLQGADLSYELEQRALREELAAQLMPAPSADLESPAELHEDAVSSPETGIEIVTLDDPQKQTASGKRTPKEGVPTSENAERENANDSGSGGSSSASEDVYLPGSATDPSQGRDSSGREGKPVGLISIPSIGVDSVLVWGVSLEALEKGPGVMPQRSMPGQHGNAVVSGHRNIHGGVFYKLDKLKYGDKIIVTYQGQEHVYEVRGTAVVDPEDVSVVRQTRGVRLTLTTCTPIGTDKYRLIVQAELVDGPLESYALDRGDWKFAR